MVVIGGARGGRRSQRRHHRASNVACSDAELHGIKVDHGDTVGRRGVGVGYADCDEALSGAHGKENKREPEEGESSREGDIDGSVVTWHVHWIPGKAGRVEVVGCVRACRRHTSLCLLE
jgi:hypothetical protein